MSRGKKSKKPKQDAAASGRWRRSRSVVAALLTLAVAGGVLAGLVRLGDEALQRIGLRSRYLAQFADVQCETPPGCDRPTFLAEVRYVGNFPETFNALDPGDRNRLTAAFAAHPWVESVLGVRVEPGNVVRVALAFREPALAVTVEGGRTRLVDRGGVLLPESPVPSEVATLATPVPAPRATAGQLWDQTTVGRAVELVKAYQPRRLERGPSGWRLTQPDGRVLVVSE